MKSGIFFVVAVLLCLTLSGVGCQKDGVRAGAERKIVVVTTLFPLYDFARSVGGTKVDVSMLLPPGVEPHEFEPRPADMIKIENADIFVYTGKYMEPWAGKILSAMQDKKFIVVDADAGIALQKAGKGYDPHVWLDFSKALGMVDNIEAALAARDDRDRGFFAANAEAYKAKLRRMDDRYRETLSRCRRNTVIHAGHFAFGYLAKRYGLRYVSAYPGFTPDTEPTPQRMVKITDWIRQYDVKCVFYEELVMPRVAETIAKETGVRLLMLHGAHNVSREEMERGVTFLSLMEKNLERLKAGLECQ